MERARLSAPARPFHIDILTLFPEWFASPLEAALLGKARENGLVDIALHNPREHATDKHHTVDDRPYGGGPGMVMMAPPIAATLREITASTSQASTPALSRSPRMLLMAASGRPLTQVLARELACEEHLVILCGRYEGIDARLEEAFGLEPVSVGEAVLNGGEAAALMVIEAVTRLIPGFMGKEASGDDESFSEGLLEYPHYTRPELFEGQAVPEVLRGGDHARIAQWRREKSLLTTFTRRPDMLDEAALSAADIDFLQSLPPHLKGEKLGRNLFIALVHHPVLLERMRTGREKSGTTSLTNLDVHDIARCSRTYGLGECIVVTPLEDQRRLLHTLKEHWTTGAGGRANADRAAALGTVRAEASLAEAIAYVAESAGQKPFVIGTSARPEGGMAACQVRERLREGPVLLVFGTGHGLAGEALAMCDAIMRPVRWLDTYNHLPVRGAAAVILDRILGDRY